MNPIVGIRREDLDKRGERRVPLTPREVSELTRAGVRVLVQPAVEPETGQNKRAFPDGEYSDAGAEITEDLSPAHVILGVKEISTQSILPDKYYFFFSHTHKGQKKNRPLLRKLVQSRATVTDFELITDSSGGRVITAFTYFAGYAGMFDTLWAFGEKLRLMGIDSPFRKVRQSINYSSLEEAKAALKEVGEEIRREGTPHELPPVVTVFLGRGRTSSSAQSIYNLLPVEKVSIQQLPRVFEEGDRRKVYSLVLRVYEMYRLKPEFAGRDEGLRTHQEKFQHYIENPHMYESNLDNVLPYTSILMNCTYWEPKYPRVLPSSLLRELTERGRSSLLTIGDISCDPDGNIEFSKETWIDQPVFSYSPLSGERVDGFHRDMIPVMAITNLPCEFSAEASSAFASQFYPIFREFIEIFRRRGEELHPEELPPPVGRGTILWKGEFRPNYQYMEKFLQG